MKASVFRVAMGIGMALFLPTLVQSCCSGDLDSYFDVTGLRVRNIEDGGRTRNDYIPGQDSYRNVSEAYTESYGLYVSPQLRYYASVPAAAALHACSPDEGGKGTREIIEDIQVTSNQDFDEQHPAGSSLNDLFSINDIYTHELIELNQFLQGNPAARREKFILRMRKKPTKSMIHQFTIKYAHTDGERFEETAKPITFY